MPIFEVRHTHRYEQQSQSAELLRVESALSSVLQVLFQINHKLEKLMALDPAVQKIVDDVAAIKTTADAALAALAAEATQIATQGTQITGLQQQITDLQNQIANGQPISAENLTALGGAAADLEATNAKLSQTNAAAPAAVVAGTPDAGTPTPAAPTS